MGGKVQRQKDLEQAKERRAQVTAAKKQHALRMLSNDFTVEETARTVGADEKTVKRWRDEATSTDKAR